MRESKEQGRSDEVTKCEEEVMKYEVIHIKDVSEVANLMN